MIWLIWDGFWKKTNIAGINNAGNSKASVLRRAIWIGIFLGFSVCTVDLVIGVIKEFFQYPVDTNVVVQHLDRVNLLFLNNHVCNDGVFFEYISSYKND